MPHFAHCSTVWSTGQAANEGAEPRAHCDYLRDAARGGTHELRHGVARSPELAPDAVSIRLLGPGVIDMTNM